MKPVKIVISLFMRGLFAHTFTEIPLSKVKILKGCSSLAVRQTLSK